MLASRDLGTGEEQIKKGDYRRANIALRDGLEGLGGVFLGDDVIDDTGQHLSLARGLEWDGNLKPAAEERRRMLAERLADYAQIENLKACPTPSAVLTMAMPFPNP